jgi:hypothetical protein
MRRRKMKQEGICPYCNIIMQYENGENGYITEYWWECNCGRNFDTNGKDITDYELTNIKEINENEIKKHVERLVRKIGNNTVLKYK